jgi:hypothetical protein
MSSYSTPTIGDEDDDRDSFAPLRIYYEDVDTKLRMCCSSDIYDLLKYYTGNSEPCELKIYSRQVNFLRTDPEIIKGSVFVQALIPATFKSEAFAREADYISEVLNITTDIGCIFEKVLHSRFDNVGEIISQDTEMTSNKLMTCPQYLNMLYYRTVINEYLQNINKHRRSKRNFEVNLDAYGLNLTYKDGIHYGTQTLTTAISTNIWCINDGILNLLSAIEAREVTLRAMLITPVDSIALSSDDYIRYVSLLDDFISKYLNEGYNFIIGMEDLLKGLIVREADSPNSVQYSETFYNTVVTNHFTKYEALWGYSNIKRCKNFIMGKSKNLFTLIEMFGCLRHHGFKLIPATTGIAIFRDYGSRVQIEDPEEIVLVYGSFIAHFLFKYRMRNNAYPKMDLRYLRESSQVKKTLRSNLRLNITKLKKDEIKELSMIIFDKMFSPYENLEFSDFADDKSTVPDAGVMLDTIIKEQRLHKSKEGRLILKLLSLQKGELLKLVKELDEGTIPDKAFFVQGCVKENEVSTKGRLFVVVNFVVKVLVVSINTHLKKNLYQTLDEITVTLDADAFKSRIERFITSGGGQVYEHMFLGVDYLKWNNGWRFASQRLFLRFYTQINGWKNLGYMLWYFFTKAEITQAAPYHINLNKDKTDFKESLKIRTSGNTEGFNHESVMPFDAGVYILASIRILGPVGGYVDFLIHGDNQIIKVNFINPNKSEGIAKESFRKNIMEKYLQEVENIRKKTCCHLKPNDTIISKNCFIFHKTIYIGGIGVFPVIKTLSSLNFKRADEPLTIEGCIKNITAGIMDLSAVARSIEGLGFMKGSEIAQALYHYFSNPTSLKVQRIMQDIICDNPITADLFITTPGALEELEPIDNTPSRYPRTKKVKVPIKGLSFTDMVYLACFTYGILTPDTFPTDNAPLSNIFISAARETASEAYHDLRSLRNFVDQKFLPYLDSLSYIPLVSKAEPDASLNAWSGINFSRPINKTSLINKTMKNYMRTCVGDSDMKDILNHVEDKNETAFNLFTPEEVYPKVNVTIYKAFPLSTGKRIVSSIEKTTTFRKLAKGRGSIWASTVEVVSYNQLIYMLYRLNYDTMIKSVEGEGTKLFDVYKHKCMTKSIRELHKHSNRRPTNGVVAPTAQCLLSRTKGDIDDHITVRVDVASLVNKCGSSSKEDSSNERFYSRTETNQLVACSTRRQVTNLKATTMKKSFKPCKDVIEIQPHLITAEKYKVLCELVVQCQTNAPIRLLFLNALLAAGSLSHKGGADEDNMIKEHINPSLSATVEVSAEETPFTNTSEFSSPVIFPIPMIFTKSYALLSYSRYEKGNSLEPTYKFYFSCKDCMEPASDTVFDMKGFVNPSPKFEITNNDFLYIDANVWKLKPNHLEPSLAKFIKVSDLDLSVVEKDVLVSHNIAVCFFIDALINQLPFGVMNLLRLANMDLFLISLGYCILTYAFASYPTNNTDNLHANISQLTNKVSDKLSSHIAKFTNNDNVVSRLLNNGIQKRSCKKSYLDKGSYSRIITAVLNYLTQTNKEVLYCYFNQKSSKKVTSFVRDFSIHWSYLPKLKRLSEYHRDPNTRRPAINSKFIKSHIMNLFTHKMTLFTSFDLTSYNRYKALLLLILPQVYANLPSFNLDKARQLATSINLLSKEDLVNYEEVSLLGDASSKLDLFRSFISGNIEVISKKLLQDTNLNSKSLAVTVVPMNLPKVSPQHLDTQIISRVIGKLQEEPFIAKLSEDDLWKPNPDDLRKNINELHRVGKLSTSTPYKVLEIFQYLRGIGFHNCDGNGTFSYLAAACGNKVMFHQTKVKFNVKGKLRGSNIPAWAYFVNHGIHFLWNGFSEKYGSDVLTESYQKNYERKLKSIKGPTYGTCDWENSFKGTEKEIEHLHQQKDFILWQMMLHDQYLFKMYATSVNMFMFMISEINMSIFDVYTYVPILSSYLSKEIYILVEKRTQQADRPLYATADTLMKAYYDVQVMMTYRQNNVITSNYGPLIETKLFGDVVPVIKGKITDVLSSLGMTYIFDVLFDSEGNIRDQFPTPQGYGCRTSDTIDSRDYFGSSTTKFCGLSFFINHSVKIYNGVSNILERSHLKACDDRKTAELITIIYFFKYFDALLLKPELVVNLTRMQLIIFLDSQSRPLWMDVRPNQVNKGKGFITQGTKSKNLFQEPIRMMFTLLGMFQRLGIELSAKALVTSRTCYDAGVITNEGINLLNNIKNAKLNVPQVVALNSLRHLRIYLSSQRSQQLIPQAYKGYNIKAHSTCCRYVMMHGKVEPIRGFFLFDRNNVVMSYQDARAIVDNCDFVNLFMTLTSPLDVNDSDLSMVGYFLERNKAGQLI